jgi:hypothetical protein
VAASNDDLRAITNEGTWLESCKKPVKGTCQRCLPMLQFFLGVMRRALLAQNLSLRDRLQSRCAPVAGHLAATAVQPAVDRSFA